MKETKNAPKPEKKSQRAKGKGLKTFWKYIYMFRGVLISIPIAVVAIILAFKNAGRLPETVGIELLATGEFATTVSRTTAVLIPMAMTGLCIVLTCISKRMLFPWLVSLFSLVLPLLIWLTNIYPA